jgi:NifU-like protein involved in Fe-S cluster formation
MSRVAALPPILEDHFRHPRGVGRLAGASGRGKSENPACGDVLEIEVACAGGRVREARFMAHGCSSVIAVASLVVGALGGRSLEEARGFDVEGAVAAAGGLPNNRRHAVSVVSRALLDALSGAVA